jgi:hypothetical protein
MFNYNLQIKERYNDWMSSTIHTLTPAGRIKKPSYSTVATWVKESWDEVDEGLIKRSFKCCGISTNTNGSEDDVLFDYDRLLGKADNDDEVDLGNSDDEEYSEDDDYENEWEIETYKNNNKKINGNDDGNKEAGDEGEKLSSDEEERPILEKLRKKYKGN